MKNDSDLDWSDDFFDGDIDFNDDFESQNKKGFIAGLMSGFVAGAVDQTVGSSEAITRTLKNVLPSTYSTFFDKVEYFKTIKDDLVREFKEENYENVKSLQNIAKKIGQKIDNENSAVRKRLDAFSEDDFSSWEKHSSGSSDELPTFENETYASFNEDVNRLIQAQQEAMASSASGLNEMQAQVGGTIVAAIKTSNRGLLGIESGMRDLLNYQRNVQYKMDKTLIELTAKNYILDAKFYKFAEKANHKIIEELKKVVENSGKTDFQKTSLLEEAKSKTRDKALNVVGRRVGGFINKISNQFTSEKRKGLYGDVGGVLEDIEDILSGGDDISTGSIYEGIGRILGSAFARDVPMFLKGAKARDFVNNQLSRFSEGTQGKVRNTWDRVRNFGNVASYLSTSGGGLLNYYARGWESPEIGEFNDYEEYVEYAKANNLRVLPKAIYYAYYTGKDIVNERIDRAMSAVRQSRSRGMQYTITQHDSKTLTNVGQWKEINNIALVDVIPGWLSKIYESQEKARTGNDSFKAPVFSYTRRQFVDRNIATKIVKNDVFEHNNFLSTAQSARRIVSQIDDKGILTDKQAGELALRIARNADETYGFNPFQYLGEIEGLDPNLQKVVNQLIRDRFGIDDEKIEAHSNATGFSKISQVLNLIKGSEGDSLNSISAMVDELRSTIPNIAKAIESNRDAGNEELLRELGLIKTKYGTDQIDVELIWDRIKEYLLDPKNPELRGDFIDTIISDAGSTRGVGGGRQTTINKTNLGGLNESINSLTETFKEQIKNLDFSNISFDLQGIPDKFDLLNKTADEQKTLLSKISECVCRTANGWGNKTQTEKDRINREENEGKRSLLEKIKGFTPRGFFNKSIETLANNSPLILTGLAGALAGYAFKDPKTAALLAGGIGFGYLYGRIKGAVEGSEPSDDENIYNENGDVLLYASKLRNGDYWDVTSNAVLTTWKGIKGAVYDVVTKTYTTLSQLTGKLFGPDNRRRVLTGLSKAKDFARSVWNKMDISGTFGKLTTAAKNAIYQQDVYVVGDSEPRLTRNGFRNKRYYCMDPSTKQPFVINGWNDIKGPVYEIDESDMLTQIITEGEIAQGLMTSSGMKLDALKDRLSWAKDKLTLGATKLFGITKEKVGIGAKKVVDFVRGDYYTIETRLDRIYYLLCDEFGRPREPLPSDGIGPEGSTRSNEHKPGNVFGEAFKSKTAGVKTKFSNENDYPHKVRLNSFEDKAIKEEEVKRDAFYEDVHSIKEHMDENSVGGTDPKKKKGLWGMLGTVLGAGFGIFKKLFTNPLGLLGDAVGMVIGSILKSPLRLVKLGSLLFRGVLGLASPIYKLLRWGLTGILGALGRGTLNLLDGYLPGGKKRRQNRKTKTRTRRTTKRAGGSRFRGRGRGIGGLIAGGLAMMPFMASGNDSDDYNDDYYEEGGNGYENDYGDAEGYDEDVGGSDYDPSDSMGNRVVDGLYDTEAALYMGGAAINGGGRAAQRLAPGMSKALASSKMAGGALKAIGGVGKLATGIAGKAFWPLAALQAGLAFADGDTVGDIFNTNVIDGRQRAAHAVTDFLDLGGLVSGSVKGIGNLLGFDTSKVDGAATRFVGGLLDNKLTNWLTDIPGAELIPFVGAIKALKNFKTDLSSTQRKIRIAMYGIKDTKDPLAAVVENIERQLLEYVRVNEGYVTIAKNAPLAQIAQSLSQTNVPEAAVWIKQRFLPIYKIWISACSLLGYSSLDALDKDKRPTVLKLVNQVEGAVTQFNPFPYEIAPVISKEYPIMNRAATEERLAELNKEIRTEFKEQGVDAEGNIDTKTVIRTSEEVKEGKPESDGWFNKATSWINSKFTKLSLIGFEEPKDVVAIDISDLHPGDGKTMDELTMVRLGVYGNTESNPIKVDAVLKLERYCEQFFVVRSNEVLFEKQPKEILAIFKNSFQLVPSWYEYWEKWFTDRFLPVIKTWVREVYKVRGKMPKDCWTKLSATNRSDIAHALVDVKIDVKGKVISVWEVEEGPFFNTTSGTEAVVVKKYVDALDTARAEKILKDPVAEKAASSGVSDVKPLTDEEKYAMYHGGMKSNFSSKSNPSQKGSGELDSLINQVNTGGVQTSTGNYNESLLPAADSGAYDPIDGNGDPNYKPDSKVSGKEFTIQPREAKKTILNEFIKAGYKDPITLAFAVANAEVETGLQGRTEDLNYKASILPIKFSSFKDNPDLATKYGRTNDHPANKRMIARIAYGRGSLARTLGNANEDDGEKYIGRGYTQITGKYNYGRVGKLMGENFIDNPDKVGSDPIMATRSNIGFFKMYGVDKALQAGDVDGATGIINKNDREHRDEKIALTNKYLKELQSGELKNILDEVTSKNNTEQATTEDNADIEKTASQVNLNGLDGTNKVNVPSADSTDPAAPALTSPAVSTAETQKASETASEKTSTALSPGETQTTNVSQQPQQTVAAPQTTAEKPQANQTSKEKAKEPEQPKIAAVYDSAVVSAIDRLSKSLESVLSTSKRVSVGSRNL